jgi:hypothetical protein
MCIHYFDALAGAGKTRALARHSDRIARRGHKVLFAQPTKHLITKTIEDELEPLHPSYPVRAIHGDTDPGGVIAKIVAHFQQTVDGGEVLFITHSAFMSLPYIEKKSHWHLIVDEVPEVDVFSDLRLPDNHHLITPYLDLMPCDAAYGLLVAKEDAR